MSWKGYIFRESSLRRCFLAIIILLTSVWWASADTLAQEGAPARLKMTAPPTLWSLEGPTSNRAPHLVIGMADRGDTPSYSSLRLVLEEAATPLSARNTSGPDSPFSAGFTEATGPTGRDIGMTGRTTDEINEYLAAVRLGLDKWDLFLNLGLAYLGQNDYPKAIKTLQISVLLGPDHPEAHFNLAIAYERSSRLHEALQEVTASLLLAPSDPDEHNAKAIICAKLGYPVCARDEWAHLVQVAPDYTPARVNLAILSGLHMSSAASTSSALNGNGLAVVLNHGSHAAMAAIPRDRPHEPPVRPQD